MVEMKDSGIKWIGKIPFGWDIVPFGYLLRERSEKNYPIRTDERLSLSIDKGVTLYADKTTNLDRYKDDVSQYKIAQIGDFVMNSMNMIVGAVGVSDYFGCVSPAYYTFYDCESDSCYCRYCDYLFHTKELKHVLFGLGKGIMAIDRGDGKVNTCRLKVSRYDLKRLKLPIPPLKIIRKIVSFLDKKCFEINELQLGIEKLIETLEEYKRSIITEVITKGLNPNVKMKDSGIEWIGKIPKYWEIEKGKYTLRYLQKAVKEDDGVITCFRDGEVTLRSNRREDGFTMSDKEIGYQGIDIGDLVVHGMDGFAGAIGISDSRGKASPVLNVLDTDENKKYYMYYLRSMAYSDVFLATATGIRVRSCDLRWAKIAELPFPIPSRKEQDEIVSYIDRICNGANEIIADKKKQLEVLDQYKKSLIYEYVTGKKEVPED